MRRSRRGAAAAVALMLPMAFVNAADSAARVQLPTAAVTLSPCWNPDNGVPDLLGLQVTPHRLSVWKGAGEVAVVAKVADTGGPGPASGVRRVQVTATTGGYGSFDVYTYLRAEPDGTWRGTWRVPSGFHGGFYVDSVTIWDRAGWEREYELEELAALGFDQTFRVLGPQDRKPPRVSAFRVRSTTADVRSHDVVIPVRVRAVDDREVAQVLVRATHAASGREPVKDVLVRRAGSLRNGVWSGALHLRPGVRPGPWNLQVTVVDSTGRRDLMKAPELAAAGLPSQLEVRSVHDARPPEVELVSMSPDLVDTRTGDASVHVRVRVSDTGTGVQEVRAELAFPERDEDGWPFYTEFSRAVMTRVKAGIYEAVLPVSRCEPRYKPEQHASYDVHLLIDAKDRARNWGTLKPRPVLQLVAGDTIRPLTYAPRTPVPASGPITVAFGEPLVGVTSLILSPHDWMPQDGDPPPVPATWTCADAARAPVSCSDGPVQYATITPISPLRHQTPYIVDPNPEHVLSALDPAGNPALGDGFFVK